MIVKSQNFRGEFSIPEDFEDFIGYDGQADKTSNGYPYSITFGSTIDQASAKLSTGFEEHEQNPSGTNVFDIFTAFIEQIILLGRPIEWA